MQALLAMLLLTGVITKYEAGQAWDLLKDEPFMNDPNSIEWQARAALNQVGVTDERLESHR